MFFSGFSYIRTGVGSEMRSFTNCLVLRGAHFVMELVLLGETKPRKVLLKWHYEASRQMENEFHPIKIYFLVNILKFIGIVSVYHIIYLLCDCLQNNICCNLCIISLMYIYICLKENINNYGNIFYWSLHSNLGINWR